MQKIRFTKMFCFGLVEEDKFIGGFERELTFLPEVYQFFLWKFARHRGKVAFLNRLGKPVFIDPADMTPDEREYWGVEQK